MGRKDVYTTKIREICSVPCGRTATEIIRISGGSPGTLGVKLPTMVAAGALTRTGLPRHYRYFTYPHHAEAWELQQEQEATQPPATPEKSPTEAARPAAKAKNGRGPALGAIKPRNRADSIAGATQVTWPTTVRVQVAPTPRDTRFTFDPPPGWKGEFGREWEQKRNSHG